MTASRRDFIEQSATLFSGAWLALNLPVLESLAEQSRLAFEQQQPFESLTAAEARTMAAFAEQIIPTTDTPGAREAGAVYFIDRSFKQLRADFLPIIQQGARDLDQRAQKSNRNAKSFADLTAAQQIAILKKIEDTPFFGLARSMVVIGTFGDPKYGGGRNNVGNRILQIDHQPVYQPPFGYYDARATRSAQ